LALLFGTGGQRCALLAGISSGPLAGQIALLLLCLGLIIGLWFVGLLGFGSSLFGSRVLVSKPILENLMEYNLNQSSSHIT